MKTLYIIGNAESEFVRPCRISENPAVKPTERIWATLSAEKLGEFKKNLDIAFSDYRTSAGHYNRSVQVIIHHLLSAAWKDTTSGLEFTLEIHDCDQHGYSTTLVRRAKPTPPRE